MSTADCSNRISGPRDSNLLILIIKGCLECLEEWQSNFNKVYLIPSWLNSDVAIETSSILDIKIVRNCICEGVSKVERNSICHGIIVCISALWNSEGISTYIRVVAAVISSTIANESWIGLLNWALDGLVNLWWHNNWFCYDIEVCIWCIASHNISSTASQRDCSQIDSPGGCWNKIVPMNTIVSVCTSLHIYSSWSSKNDLSLASFPWSTQERPLHGVFASWGSVQVVEEMVSESGCS